MKKLLLLAAACAMLALGAVPVSAATTVPGHTDKYDADNNGFPDAGQNVNGRYKEFAYGCDLTVTYRGDFNNDAYLDSGVIQNHYVCKYGKETATYNYQIVHKSDPRYQGNPDWAVWGEWEYHVLTQGGHGNEPYGGNGNLVRPYSG